MTDRSKDGLRRKLLACSIASALAVPGAGASAQVDEVQLRLLTQFELPLRWDNVQPGSPYWELGIVPSWRKDYGFHAIRLEPGQAATVRVPAGETLRLHGLNERLPPGSLSVSLSNGSGLYVQQRARSSEDGKDWLVEVDASGPQLARISLEAGGPTSLNLALFVSRREPLDVIAPYRRLIPLPGPSMELRRAIDAAGQPYWPLSPERIAAIEVLGPARYALRARLHYPVAESALAQGWRIETRLNGQSWGVLGFETAAENAYPVFLNGREAVVNREKEGYLEIPPGRHQLSLAGSGPLLIRLLKQEDPDYLFPALNEPTPSAREVRAGIDKDDPVFLGLSDLGGSGADAAAIVARRNASPALVIAAGQELLKDNRQREGSMLAAGSSLQASHRRRDLPSLRSEANEIFHLHTYLRDLLPRDKPESGHLRFAWYLTPTLKDIGESGRGNVAAGQHESQLLGWMDSGFFLPLGDSPDTRGRKAANRRTVLAYDLPQRFTPTYLRLAVHGGGTGENEKLYLQYDDQPPIVLTVAPFPDLPGDRFVPSASEAALRLQEQRHGEYGVGTLSAAFSRHYAPAPLIPAGVIEVPLPRSVRQVRLWREVGNSSPLWAAVRLRGAKPYRLPERAYLDAARKLRQGPSDEFGAVPAFLVALGSVPEVGTESSNRDSDSHWQPLARLMRARAKTFNVSVAAPSGSTAIGKPAAAAIAEATRLAERGQWLPALEAWSRAVASPLPRERETAFWGQVATLRQLGEEFLVEQLLKQEMLHGADPPARGRARDALADIYHRANDQEALQATYAAAFIRDPEVDTATVLAGIATALLDNGEAEMALTAGLLLPRQQRSMEIMLRAASAVEWWQVFEDLVAQLPNAERQFYWRAQRALTQGRLTEAETDLQRAGSDGQSMAAHMASARSIRVALAQRPDGQAMTNWAQWIFSHPGYRTWRDASFLVTDFAGAESLYSIDGDTYLSAFRSEPGRPLRLRLAGPVKLRIDARPLHPTGSTERIEGWLRIRVGDRHWQTPITQNAVATGLVTIGRPEITAGRRIAQELEFGPGWHEIEADGGELPLLLRVQTEQPELLLPLLPPLTPDTAVARPLGVKATPAPVFRRLLGGCPDCSLLMDVLPGAQPRYERFERNLLDANPTRLSEKPPLPDLPTEVVADEAALRAAGQWKQLLDWPTDRSDAALRERMLSLVWIGEHQPDQYLAVVALAEAILAANPMVSGLAALVGRLARNSTWTPIDIVNSSAGLRSREIAGWQPEAPALRVRRALLAPTSDDERVLAGGNRLVISFTNTQPALITLAATSADVAALPPQPLVAMLQTDDGVPQRILLEPGSNLAERAIPIPTGRHSLRLWIDAPLSDQFLRVRLSEAGRSQFAESVERFYHVATPQEPVRVAIPGPAWVRIDEWAEDRSESRYRWIDKDREELVLKPQEGRREALYRIHMLTLAAGRPVTQPRALNPEPTPVPDPPVVIPERLLVDPAQLKDGLRLGGQEDGTWSIGLSWQERLYGRDSSPPPAGVDNSQIPVEKFAEFAAVHRYFDEDRQTHFRTEFLARQRRLGGPTLGVRGLASISPPWTGWNLAVNGGIFAQNPAGQGGPQWSWNLGATATQKRDINPMLWHLPRLSVFSRGSSVSDSPYYRTGQLDQDIFTPYQAKHRRGFEAGDTLTWRPWLDTEFYAGANLVSNEAFNPVSPDHIANFVGWRQLLGPIWLRAQWGGNHYLADSQRAKAANNSSLNIDLGWERWLPHQERIELALTLRREIDVGNTRVGLSFIWHFGNGRAYRDFRPAEIDFLDLRKRRVPQQQNNRMSEEP